MAKSKTADDPMKVLLGGRYDEYKMEVERHANCVAQIEAFRNNAKEALSNIQKIITSAAKTNGAVAGYTVTEKPARRRGRPPKVESDKEVPTKRRRGRPPKAETATVEAPKKRRGRPPKAKVEEVEAPKTRRPGLSKEAKDLRKQNPVFVWIQEEGLTRDQAEDKLSIPKGTMNALLSGKYRPAEAKLRGMALTMGKDDASFIKEFYKWHEKFLTAAQY